MSQLRFISMFRQNPWQPLTESQLKNTALCKVADCSGFWNSAHDRIPVSPIKICTHCFGHYHTWAKITAKWFKSPTVKALHAVLICLLVWIPQTLFSLLSTKEHCHVFSFLISGWQQLVAGKRCFLAKGLRNVHAKLALQQITPQSFIKALLWAHLIRSSTGVVIPPLHHQICSNTFTWNGSFFLKWTQTGNVLVSFPHCPLSTPATNMLVQFALLLLLLALCTSCLSDAR